MTTFVIDSGPDRRSQIMEVAKHLFAERGYTQTSLADIADPLGLTGPALYHWFPNKREILFQLMEETIAEIVSETESVLAAHDDPIEALARLAEIHVNRVLSNREANNVYRRERVHLTPENDAAISTHEAKYEALLQDVYARGVATGRLVPVDPAIGADAFLGGSRWAYRAIGKVPGDELARTAVRLVMRSIVADPKDPVFDTLEQQGWT